MSWISFKCPRCHSLMTTNALEFSWRSLDWAWVPNNLVKEWYANWYQERTRQYLYKCANKDCNSLIIRDCIGSQDNLICMSHTTPSPFNFSQYPGIQSISPSFIKLYNDAWRIEQLWYKEIAWPWYRKAIEYLIKDFVIHTEIPDLGEENIEDNEKWKEIAKMSISSCINKYLENPILKEIVTRAFWLWNDQVHYYQKRENKDIDDLKKAISVSMHHIEMSLNAEDILKDMS